MYVLERDGYTERMRAYRSIHAWRAHACEHLCGMCVQAVQAEYLGEPGEGGERTMTCAPFLEGWSDGLRGHMRLGRDEGRGRDEDGPRGRLGEEGGGCRWEC